MAEFTSWQQAATVLAGLAATLIGLIWRDLRVRIDALERQMTLKADACELHEQRVEIMHDLDKQRAQIVDLNKSSHAIDISLATIKEQNARVVSDLESEKRTRNEANNRIFNQLEKIRVSIEQRGKRYREEGD